MSKVIHGRGYVYSLQYHLVWCVKYRRKVLVNEIEKSLKEILIQLCKDHEITIEEMETDKDHIHMLISLKPQHYIPTVVKTLKGQSARRLFKLHPEIKGFLWGGHLWNPSYFIATVSENTEEQVRRYIQSQKQK
ncbi:IS200/IS605 family transposase [Schinkia azotoformans]|uniref:IS200/IS605 family transposase n=1 Tax=Schinkia azotoformans TaxID=1454 RepID=UPI002DB8735B|nr:IS200/IS605 family transposase [Schinkia azotoformans]MEC1719157.1 IS200/IS605 family transposase [Schinkia azotoformans]MED4415893.1 IS200/IS605 family transposase [Schinkia azotoformans]